VFAECAVLTRRFGVGGEVAVFVKICGTTNLADAELAVELGADALGFIFAPSKRQVSVKQAAEITSRLPAKVQRIGVFTGPPIFYELQEAVLGAGLTGIQMHWPVHEGTTEIVQQMFGETVQMWQVVSYNSDIGNEYFLAQLASSLNDDRLAGVLLDSQTAASAGGTGVPLPWGQMADLVASAVDDEGRASRGGPHLIAAGGLRAENVGEAIRTLRPWGVDVVSGVEASPGKKSPDRLRAFMEAVRGAS
jgi:phosphoribosylanthranilate isomerase